MARFTDKVALITGGVKGIGRAAADRLISEGARAAILDIDVPSEGLDPESGGKRLFLKTDVTDPKAVKNALKKIEEIWGPVEILVNNAGIHHVGTILDTPVETWEKVLKINLTGAFVVAQAVAAAICMLADDEIGYATGTVFSIDGGKVVT